MGHNRSTQVAQEEVTVERSEAWHKLSRPALITLVVVCIAAIGGAGLLAGKLMEKDDAGHLDLEPTFPSGPQLPIRAAPIAAVQIGPGPSPSPSEIVDPLPTTSPSPFGTEDRVVVLQGGVAIPLPPPWQVVSQDGIQALIVDGRGNGIYAYTFPATGLDASFICYGFYEAFILKSGFYTGLEDSGCKGVETFGSIQSFQTIRYRGLAADPQGTIPLAAQMWIAIRRDGFGLLAIEETRPPESFEPNKPQWGPVINGTFKSFGSI